MFQGVRGLTIFPMVAKVTPSTLFLQKADSDRQFVLDHAARLRRVRPRGNWESRVGIDDFNSSVFKCVAIQIAAPLKRFSSFCELPT